MRDPARTFRVRTTDDQQRLLELPEVVGRRVRQESVQRRLQGGRVQFNVVYPMSHARRVRGDGEQPNANRYSAGARLRPTLAETPMPERGSRATNDTHAGELVQHRISRYVSYRSVDEREEDDGSRLTRR